LAVGRERVVEGAADAATDATAARPVAVLDLGSNSVRLVIYDKLGRAPFPRFNEKSLCGLGGELDSTGRLPEAGILCTLQAVRRYGAIARAMRAERVDIIATEALRRAENGPDLLARIEAESGHRPHLLSGDDEARLAAMGVASGFHEPSGMVGDLGGGSLELARIREGAVEAARASLPLGALRVRAMMGEAGDSAKKRVDAMLGEVAGQDTGGRFYAVGGGWRALARIHIAGTGNPIKVTHGLELDPKEARKLAKSLLRRNRSELAALPGLPRRRLDTLPAAALVFDRVVKRLRPDRVVFSALGLREGWLHGCLPEEEKRADPLVVGAREFGRPRSRVESIGVAMAEWTAQLFPEETAGERRLRLAVAELSDIGWRDHPEVRAFECFTRLLQFPFVALDHGERVFLAAAIHARYGGSANDPRLAPALALLDAAARRRALILGRALQLGYRFSGSVPELLREGRLRRADDALIFEVASTEMVPEADVVRSRLKNLGKAMGVRRTEIRTLDAARF